MRPDPRNPNTPARVSEQTFMNALLVKLNTLPHVRAWRRNAGIVSNGRGGMVKLGAAGLPDIYGVAYPGIHFEVECKAPGGKLTDAQARAETVLDDDLGAVYVFAEAFPDETAEQSAAYWCERVRRLIEMHRDAWGMPPEGSL